VNSNLPKEYLIERQFYKDRINKWRFLSFVIIAILIITLGIKIPLIKNVSTSNISDQYIASVNLEGVIMEDLKRDKKLEDICDIDDIKAVIVNVNSPGGSVVGSERIFNIFRKISQKKPIVVVMGTLAASGGYLVSLGADYIFTHNGTITGSIGVIFQTQEVTELAEKLGIKLHTFKSGEFKATPNIFEKLTDKVKDVTMINIYDSYEYFIELVSKRRNLPMEEVRKLADGRVYSGRQAVKLKLVDAIGNNDDALKWLQTNKKIDKSLKIGEYSLSEEGDFFEMLTNDFSNLAFVKKIQNFLNLFSSGIMSSSSSMFYAK
jgi:protease-4